MAQSNRSNFLDRQRRALRFLADLKSGKYDHEYFYFDVHAGDWLFLCGTVNWRHAPPGPLARALLVWERECARVHRTEERWPTLAEQRACLDPDPPNQIHRTSD